MSGLGADLEVTLQCPVHLKPGKSTILNATVSSRA